MTVRNAGSASAWPSILPSSFFMAFAPLDVWVRALARAGLVSPWYWFRLGHWLWFSALGTILTLPERLAFAVYDRIVPPRNERINGPIFVLGYYRTGTTHLQYLLSCDPNLYTMRWYQAALPHGFILSWLVLRLFLLMVGPNRRPMDDLRVGSGFPAEDQIAMNNWSLASSMPGRTILPNHFDYFRRFQTLERLEPEEFRRWQRYQAALIRKLSLIAGGRMLLLKSPSHTAIVPQLLELLRGAPRVKFVHIARDPEEVLASNLRMHRDFHRMWGLEGPLDDERLRQELLDDYVETERRYLAIRQSLPAGTLAETRFADLRANPIGELKRIYIELGLEFSAAFERRVRHYLEATQGYEPRTKKSGQDALPPNARERIEPLYAMLQSGTSQPPGQSDNMLVGEPARSVHLARAMVHVAFAAAACGLAWFVLGVWTGPTSALFQAIAWPVGLVVGYGAHRSSPKASVLLGGWAATLTLVAFGLVSSSLLWSAGLDHPDGASAIIQECARTLATWPALIFSVAAALSAFRLGSSPRMPWW